MDYQIINVNNLTNFSTISTIYFDANIRTYLYIHGCTEGPNSVSALTVIQAALTQKPNMNVVVLDWSDWSLVATLAGCPFAINTVTHNAITIFDFMRNFNFNPSNLHIVGFSFGAHLGGNLGRYFKKIGFLVPRLTCLDIPYAIGLYDPFYISLLPFILPPLLYRITRSDADLVEIYHTNAGKIGDAKMRGHLEFWFNGGVHQPGCVLFDASIFISNYNVSVNWDFGLDSIGCCHHRSWVYWAETFYRNNTVLPFIANSCTASATNTYSLSNCPTTSTVSAGWWARDTFGTTYRRTATAHFYVATNNQSLFSKS